jgi:uncharacterized RDD family membrane protein YckC
MDEKKKASADKGIRPRPGSGYKADVGRRLAAGVVDAILCVFITLILIWIPGIGWFLGPFVGALFWLTRDNLPLGFLENKSPGKKILNLRVEKLGTETKVCSTGDSVKRNLPAGIALLLIMIPRVGIYLGPSLLVVIGAMEILLILSDPEGLRLGDKIAETKVFD